MTMTIFKDLPNDLLEEILCYVPATYLKRLGSTCKRWNHLFNDDSRFARKHADKAAKQFLVLMLKTYKISPIVVNLHGSVEFKSELSLVDSHSMYAAQFDIGRVFHCDGLLLCTSVDHSRFVVWNPLTGETRWFQHSPSETGRDFVLGYYQKDNKKSYKILSYTRIQGSRNDYEMYKFSSDSWRTLDDIMAPGWTIGVLLFHSPHCVSLKGNTYWFATDRTKALDKLSLLKFDFSTEKFIPVLLPYQCLYLEWYGLSVVREEKLLVLLQPNIGSKIEIWVTNKIDESTKVVSWSKLLALELSSDLHMNFDVSFFLDEEKKAVVMMCARWLGMGATMYTVGEDSEVTHVKFGTHMFDRPALLNYVPSLVQIEQAGR